VSGSKEAGVSGRLGVWMAAEASVSAGGEDGGGGERPDGGCIAGGWGDGGDANAAAAAAAIKRVGGIRDSEGEQDERFLVK